MCALLPPSLANFIYRTLNLLKNRNITSLGKLSWRYYQTKSAPYNSLTFHKNKLFARRNLTKLLTSCCCWKLRILCKCMKISQAIGTERDTIRQTNERDDKIVRKKIFFLFTDTNVEVANITNT